MFTIEIEDGREAPLKPSISNFCIELNLFNKNDSQFLPIFEELWKSMKIKCQIKM